MQQCPPRLVSGGALQSASEPAGTIQTDGSRRRNSRSRDNVMRQTLKMAIPSGTVTLLFTDIEGSTRLWEQHPEAMATALERHDTVMRTVIESAGGYVFKTVGDAFCAAFASAKEAVAAAGAAQRALHDEEWPDEAVLRVRMAIHTGECEERDGDYFGPAVNRAARLEATAHGGQIVLSRSTAEIVRDRLPPGMGLVELGSHGLKDLSRPEEVFQLVVDGVAADFPPLRSRHAETPANLTGPVSTLVGQDARAALSPGLPPGLKRHFKAMREPHTLRTRRRVILGAGLSVSAVITGWIIVSAHGNSRPPLSSARVAQTALGYTPKLLPATCPSSAAGSPGVSCDVLVVPQDRTHPKGLQVRLLVVRAPAESSQPSADPVLELGYGDTTTAAGEGLSSTTRLYSSYIGLSQRGGQGSIPELTCPEAEAGVEASLASPPLSSKALTEQVAGFSTCRARLVAAGIDPNAYGNDAMAVDFRDLLWVMQIKQVNLLAAGSDSHLAFDIMRQYPRLVRSVSIEDGVPPGFAGFASAVANLSEALDRYAALCSASVGCHAAFPDIRGQFLRDYAQLQQHPVTVNASVQPGSAPIPVLVDGDTAIEALEAAFSSSASLPVIAALVYAPDPAVIAQAIVTTQTGGGNVPWGIEASYECKDALPGVPTDRRIQEQASAIAFPELAAIDASFQLFLRVCQIWHVQPDDPANFTPITSDIPTFLFGGALNAWTSPSWSAQMAQGLAHVVSITFPTLTSRSMQDSAAPACLATLRLDFLRRPTAHFSVSSCQAQSPPIAFVGT